MRRRPALERTKESRHERDKSGRTDAGIDRLAGVADRRRGARDRGGGTHAAPRPPPIVIGWAFDWKGAMAPFDDPALAAAQLRVKQ